MGDPEIRTERLLMRRWLDSDRTPFADLNADPEVMRYFPAVQDRTESDRSIDRFEQRFEEQGYGLWALEVLATGEFIGFTGLTFAHPRIDIGHPLRPHVAYRISRDNLPPAILS